jgi:hypothetical protein
MTVLRVATVISLLWVAGIAYLAVEHMPTMPLDISADDPATVEAFEAARFQHVAVMTAVALLPALALLMAARLWQRGHARD